MDTYLFYDNSLYLGMDWLVDIARVDPYYLSFKSKLLGFKTSMVLADRKLNNSMSEYVFKKIIKTLSISKKKLTNKKILILGG